MFCCSCSTNVTPGCYVGKTVEITVYCLDNVLSFSSKGMLKYQ